MATKTWVGTDSGNQGDYGTAANWSPSGVPLAADNVIIANSSQDITGTLDLSTNNSDLNVSGSVTINIGGVVQKGTGTVTFDGNLTYTDNVGGTNFGKIVIDPTTTLGSDCTADSIHILTGDTLITDGYEMDIGGSES